MNSPLYGIKVIDLSRVLAGPTATQLLGDLGADVVKVERPGVGDDTRKWGPPFLRDKDGNETTESSYYLAAGRNKRSIALDFTKDEDKAILLKLIAKADILIENYKVGALAKYGLSYADLKERFPNLIYCSLTGFGQTGPRAGEAGYDFMIQAMSGLMSITGPKQGPPSKVGTAISDICTGLYTVIAVQSALIARQSTGQGQYIDLALFDTQLACLSYAAGFTLSTGEPTKPMGNAHPTIVPYEAFEAADGYLILAIGNDGQFGKFCDLVARPDLATDERYISNKQRVINRESLIPQIQSIIKQRTRDEWLHDLSARHIPCGPINTTQEALADAQVAARDMVVEMDHPLCETKIKLLANPIKFSQTPVSYRHAPPTCDENREEVLRDWGV